MKPTLIKLNQIFLGFIFAVTSVPLAFSQENVSLFSITFLMKCQISEGALRCDKIDEGQREKTDLSLMPATHNEIANTISANFQIKNETQGIKTTWNGTFEKITLEQGPVYNLTLGPGFNEFNNSSSNIHHSTIQTTDPYNSLRAMSFVGPLFKKDNQIYINAAFAVPQMRSVADPPSPLLWKNLEEVFFQNLKILNRSQRRN